MHQPFSHMAQMRTLKVASFYLFKRIYVYFHVVSRDRIKIYKNTILCNCLLFYDYSFFFYLLLFSINSFFCHYSICFCTIKLNIFWMLLTHKTRSINFDTYIYNRLPILEKLVTR